MDDNVDLACYFITKHSWKGKYNRVFSIGSKGITTYNPSSLEVTNQWPYDEFVSIGAIRSSANEFEIVVRKGPKSLKTDTMKFSTQHRTDLLSHALMHRDKFSDKPQATRRFNAQKLHWSESERPPVLLEVREDGVRQTCARTGRHLTTYFYRDLHGIRPISDIAGGFSIVSGGFGRLHGFVMQTNDRAQFINCVAEVALVIAGVQIRTQGNELTVDTFRENRFGRFSTDEALTSYAEFNLEKVTPRQAEPVRRTLCLSELCLIERDPASYAVVTVRPLSEVFALIRDQKDPQLFSIEFVKGDVRSYHSTDRDSLLATLLDGVRASGNRDVCVRMTFTNRGFRHGPFTTPVDEGVESQHMKFLISPPSTLGANGFHKAVLRFNANISYAGLLHAVTADGFFSENKERLINATLSALLETEDTTLEPEQLESQLHALRRLVASKAGFFAFTKMPKMRETVGMRIVRALKRNDAAITYACVEVLNALMVPMHENYDLKQEQMNKLSIMSNKSFLNDLLDRFASHVQQQSGALVIVAMLDFLTFALCAPYSETTEGQYFDNLLAMVASHGRVMYSLFQHPSMSIVKGAGLVMKALIEEGESSIATKMQNLALTEGALPRHLLTAFFTQSNDSRLLTNRQLSRHLISLWATDNILAQDLIQRCVPSGLVNFLASPDAVPKDVDRINTRDNLKLAQASMPGGKRITNEQWLLVERQVQNFLSHWRTRIGIEKKNAREDRPIVLRKRRQRIKSPANWPLFYYEFEQDHARSDLIWNHKTREELRSAIEAEIRAFSVDRDLAQQNEISWNHREFEVTYNCLADETKIGDYYLRILLEEDEEKETDETHAIKQSKLFFPQLYHRFLLSAKPDMKCMCLQAMSLVYMRCHDELGVFYDTKYMLSFLSSCMNRQLRDRLVMFIGRLTLNSANVKLLVDAGGLREGTSIEEGGESVRESTKEWYYTTSDKGKNRVGPVSFQEMKQLYVDGDVTDQTRVWSAGMDGWMFVVQVAQLKWALSASGTSHLSPTDLSTLILNIFIRICEYYPSRDENDAIVRPVPKAKRILSSTSCLANIVQLQLTFDPVLVEKVVTLLLVLMKDNPNISRIYISGVFLFSLMYSGSNILPIAQFLKMTHLLQAYIAEQVKSSDIVQRSILSNILPDAMICFLTNYPPEKFATIFLGEFDTPEAIWNSEMRKHMIRRIATHLAEYTPKLLSNCCAAYQYANITVIQYDNLEDELFCNEYYLRHLCDTQRFPNWPISKPVQLLKDILDAWVTEVDKKPSTVSVSECYATLGLKMEDGAPVDESKVRKAYFRMAQKYHPDKNPEGREMFEKVNHAYEFICSRSKRTDGPSPMNLSLIIRAQSILFERYKDVLQPYKYAGYSMLITTITRETKDDQLFAKENPLLSVAAELTFHTVNCSALNAEQMRRENGIEVLQDAFSRCVGVLSASSLPHDLAVLVCLHIARFYAVAAGFDACRERIQENQAIVRDICRCLYYKNVPLLCSTVCSVVAAFCADFWLQTHMYQSGVLYHLLLFVFDYDVTLVGQHEEMQDESTNQQAQRNRLAEESMKACARLAGQNTTNLPPKVNPKAAQKDTVAISECELQELKTPDNPAVKRSLHSLLTPYLARRVSLALTKESSQEVRLVALLHHLFNIIEHCVALSGLDRRFFGPRF